MKHIAADLLPESRLTNFYFSLDYLLTPLHNQIFGQYTLPNIIRKLS